MSLFTYMYSIVDSLIKQEQTYKKLHEIKCILKNHIL